jgi:two-component system NtrC family sensor kinase
MLVHLKQARQEVEEYGRTLEEKVEYRSQELQKVQVQLMQSEKLAFLGRLASGVAHEINSPLTGILTFAHLLMRKVKNNPEIQEELKLIIQETTRVSTIVRGLLDFARESKPQKRPCSINELILHTLSLVEHQSVFQNIHILKDLGAQIPLILLDANQIQQVFMNILLNAADAMPAGGSLNISTAFAPGDSFLRVNFTDTGCGISKEIIHRIFDPFFTTKTGRKGTGLGLAVSYGIIERHQGKIEVQSEQGRGTSFTIKLPLESPEDISP